MWRLRLLGIGLTILAGVIVVGQLAAHAALARFEPPLTRHLLATAGLDVRWDRLRATPWGTAVFSEVRVAPLGSPQPLITACRLAFHCAWWDLIRRRGLRVRQVTVEQPQIKVAGTLPDRVTAWLDPTQPELPTLPQLPDVPIRFVVHDASVLAPGLGQFLSRGHLVADWQGGEILVRDAQARAFGKTLRARGVLTGITTADPQWAFHVRWAGPPLSGQLEFRNSLKHPTVVGQVEPADAPPIPVASQAMMSRDRIEATDIQVGAFQAVAGVVDWSQRRWSLTLAAPNAGAITIQGGAMDWRHPACDIVFNPLRAGPLTVTTTARLSASWVDLPEVGRALQGTVTTTQSVVNRQRVGECSGSWILTGRHLQIASLTCGDRTVLSGSVGLQPPFSLALSLEVLGIDAAEVAAVIEPGKSPVAAGIVHGRLDLVGTLGQPRLTGYLGGRDGKIGNTPYETATINFEGEGSVIRLLDSRIQQPGQLMILEGVVDLARLGAANVFEHVRMTPHTQSPSWREPAAATPGGRTSG